MGIYIRHFIFACIVATMSSFSITHSAAAQTVLGNPGETDAIGVWSQKFNALQMEMVAFFESPEIETLMNTIATSDNTETLRTHHSAWKQDADLRLLAFRKNIDEMPPAPVLTSDAFKDMTKVFDAQKDSLETSYSDMEAIIGDMSNLVVEIISGDDSNIIQLEKVMFTSAKKLLESENASMETNASLMPHGDHPSVPFLRLVIELNNIGIHDVDISILATDDLTTLKDRKPYIKKMEASMKRAHKQKAVAYRYTSKYRSQMKIASLMAKTPNEKRMIDIAGKMFDNFKISIDNEAKMLELSQKQIDLYKQDKDFWDIDEEIGRMDDQVFKLIDRRLDLQNDRTLLVQDMQ